MFEPKKILFILISGTIVSISVPIIAETLKVLV